MLCKDQTSSSCVYIQPHDIPTLHPVTLPLKSMYFQMFCKKLLPKNYRSYNFEKVPNESKLIYAINIFIVASRFLLFSYGSSLNAKTNYNDSFR